MQNNCKLENYSKKAIHSNKFSTIMFIVIVENSYCINFKTKSKSITKIQNNFKL